MVAVPTLVPAAFFNWTVFLLTGFACANPVAAQRVRAVATASARLKGLYVMMGEFYHETGVPSTFLGSNNKKLNSQGPRPWGGIDTDHRASRSARTTVAAGTGELTGWRRSTRCRSSLSVGRSAISRISASR